MLSADSEVPAAASARLGPESARLASDGRGGFKVYPDAAAATAAAKWPGATRNPPHPARRVKCPRSLSCEHALSLFEVLRIAGSFSSSTNPAT